MATQQIIPQGSRLLFEAIKEAGITTIASLPELKLRALIDLVSGDASLRHVQLCREEEGVAICAGSYLAGGKPALLMQNGGLMNSVNGLTSTAIYFQIPTLLLIYYAGDFGDRGFASVGSVTENILQALGIRYQVLRRHEDIRPQIVGGWVLAEDFAAPRRRAAHEISSTGVAMQRFPYLQALDKVLPADALVVGTSYAGREWNALRRGDGSMRTRTLGLISSLAFGIALEVPNRCVVALDGDGAFLMNFAASRPLRAIDRAI